VCTLLEPQLGVVLDLSAANEVVLVIIRCNTEMGQKVAVSTMLQTLSYVLSQPKYIPALFWKAPVFICQLVILVDL
jgi:hypothetical protein